MPRVHCTRCGIKTLSVPWARPDSGFTLLFEALVMSLVSAMPVNAVARLVGEHDTRLWRVIHHYVDRARAKADLSTVRRVAIDETAARRGHNYITLFVDIDQARVVFATDGRDAETIAFFADDLTMHGGAPSAIAEVCIDMSPAFIKGIANSLPAAAITFDKFHAVKIVNDAVDQVRRAERKVHNVLAGTRYLGSAIRSTCPTDSEPHSKTSRYAISRPHVHTASGWRSRNSMTNPLLTRRRSSSRSGTSGQPTAGCRQSSMPRALSSATGTASCAGSTAHRLQFFQRMHRSVHVCGKSVGHRQARAPDGDIDHDRDAGARTTRSTRSAAGDRAVHLGWLAGWRTGLAQVESPSRHRVQSSTSSAVQSEGG